MGKCCDGSFFLPMLQGKNSHAFAAVKKRYKFLLLKDVLILKEEGSKFRRKYVAVRYGRSETLLDTAKRNFTKLLINIYNMPL